MKPDRVWLSVGNGPPETMSQTKGMKVMDITDADGKWRITPYQIENRKTGEIRRLKNNPSANKIAYMDYRKFMRKCQTAFNTGEWPND